MTDAINLATPQVAAQQEARQKPICKVNRLALAIFATAVIVLGMTLGAHFSHQFAHLMPSAMTTPNGFYATAMTSSIFAVGMLAQLKQPERDEDEELQDGVQCIEPQDSTEDTEQIAHRKTR